MSKDQRLYKKWYRRCFGRGRHSKREYMIAARRNLPIFLRMTRLGYKMQGQPQPTNHAKRRRRAFAEINQCLAAHGIESMRRALALLGEVIEDWKVSA